MQALLLTNLQDLSVHKAVGQVPEGKDGGIVQGEGVSRRLSSAAAEEELSGIDAS